MKVDNVYIIVNLLLAYRIHYSQGDGKNNGSCDYCLVNNQTCVHGQLYGDPEDCSIFYTCREGIGLTTASCQKTAQFDLDRCLCNTGSVTCQHSCTVTTTHPPDSSISFTSTPDNTETTTTNDHSELTSISTTSKPEMTSEAGNKDKNNKDPTGVIVGISVSLVLIILVFVTITTIYKKTTKHLPTQPADKEIQEFPNQVEYATISHENKIRNNVPTNNNGLANDMNEDDYKSYDYPNLETGETEEGDYSYAYGHFASKNQEAPEGEPEETTMVENELYNS